MKRLFILLIFICEILAAHAQSQTPGDSLRIALPSEDLKQQLMGKPLFFEESHNLPSFSLPGMSMFSQPLIPDYSKNLDFSKYLGKGKLTAETYSFSSSGFSPFLVSGNVFNHATYRINDRFSFGGNSFGAQSIFDKPRMNQAIQEMSTKGASMFMQYKISKSIKVETRVSISNRQNPWEP